MPVFSSNHEPVVMFPKRPHLLKTARYVLILNIAIVPIAIFTFTSIPDTLLLGIVSLEALLIFILLPFLFVFLCNKAQNG